MDQSDIKYILEVLNDARASEDWEAVEEAVEILKEYLDDDADDIEE